MTTIDTPNVSSLPGGKTPLDAVTYGATRPGDERAITRQCTAKSTRSGKRCRKSAIKGGTVCGTHGGGARQVQNKAKLRLAILVEPAIATLGREMHSADKSADRQRAANSVLDRAGFGRAMKVEQADARELLLDLLLQAAGEDGKH